MIGDRVKLSVQRCLGFIECIHVNHLCVRRDDKDPCGGGCNGAWVVTHSADYSSLSEPVILVLRHTLDSECASLLNAELDDIKADAKELKDMTNGL